MRAGQAVFAALACGLLARGIEKMLAESPLQHVFASCDDDYLDQNGGDDADADQKGDDSDDDDRKQQCIATTVLPVLGVLSAWFIATLGEPMTLLKRYATEISALRSLLVLPSLLEAHSSVTAAAPGSGGGGLLEAVARGIGAVANNLAAVPQSLEWDGTCLDEDVELLGCAVMKKGLYSMLEEKSLQKALMINSFGIADELSGDERELRDNAVRLSRIGHLAMKMLDHKDLPFFVFDSQSSQFKVLDSSARVGIMNLLKTMFSSFILF